MQKNKMYVDKALFKDKFGEQTRSKLVERRK